MRSAQPAGRAVEHEQPARRALGQRCLGNQLFGQVVGEVVASHPRMVVQARPSGDCASVSWRDRAFRPDGTATRRPVRAPDAVDPRQRGLEVQRLAVSHDVQRDLLAGLVRSEDARRMRAAGGLTPVDREDHVAVLELEIRSCRRAHHQHALVGSEVAAQTRTERHQLHVRQAGNSQLVVSKYRRIRRRSGQQRQAIRVRHGIDHVGHLPRGHDEILRLALVHHADAQLLVRSRLVNGSHNAIHATLALRVRTVDRNDDVPGANTRFECRPPRAYVDHARSIGSILGRKLYADEGVGRAVEAHRKRSIKGLLTCMESLATSAASAARRWRAVSS